MAAVKRSRGDLIKVGVFVLIAGAVLVGGLLWIAGSRFLRPVDTYTVVFAESVSGLNAGANVEYQGVVVGRVRDLELTRDLPPKVAVIVDVEPGTPIRKDTIAALLGSLVTGIKFIQLQGGTEGAEPLPPGGTIPGDVASLEQFRNQVTEIAGRAVTILTRLQENVFTPENTSRFASFASDLGNAAESLSAVMNTFRAEETGKEIARLVREVRSMSAHLNEIVGDFASRRDDVYDRLGSTVTHIDDAVQDMRKLVNTANHELGGASTSVGTLVKELTRATDRLQETIDVIRSDPSMLLWGRKVPEREMPR